LKQNKLLKEKLKSLTDKLLEFKNIAIEMESREKIENELKLKLSNMELKQSENKILASQNNVIKIHFRAFVSMSIDLIDHLTIRALQSLNKE